MKRVMTTAAIIAVMMPRDFQAAVLLNNASRAQGSMNKVLTNFAVGVAQDSASALAEFIAPTVPTGAQHGQYKEYNEKNAFAVYDTARAVGGPRTRIEFNADDKFFNCKPQGLEIGIDDSERDGTTDPLGIERAKIRTLIISSALSHEVKVFSLIKSAKAAAAGVGAWGGTANTETDVIDEIDTQIQQIIDDTGMMPNRMVLGIGAWKIIKNHPKVKANLSSDDKEAVTLEKFASMLMNPEIEIRIGILSRDTAKAGKAASKSNVVGAEVFIFIASENPTPYDPSFAKTFQVSSTPITQVSEYRDESCDSDMYKTGWSEDVKVTGTLCGRRITVTSADS